tara:strand:+ start:233 stop:484 length:252 start_codon:yes stop_codon:yes gene_type:complete
VVAAFVVACAAAVWVPHSVDRAAVWVAAPRAAAAVWVPCREEKAAAERVAAARVEVVRDWEVRSGIYKVHRCFHRRWLPTRRW